MLIKHCSSLRLLLSGGGGLRPTAAGGLHVLTLDYTESPGSIHESIEPTDMSSIRRIISGGPMVGKHPNRIDKRGLFGSMNTLLFVEGGTMYFTVHVRKKYTNGMKRDTVPARPLAGARVDDGGNGGQSQPRQEETLLARKVKCKTCQPVRSTVTLCRTEFKVVPKIPNRSEPRLCIEAVLGQRCQAAKAARPRMTMQSTQLELSNIKRIGIALSW